MGSTEEVVQRHLQAFGACDLEGILVDYAPDAVFFTPNGPVTGTEELRAAFTAILAEWRKPGATFAMTHQSTVGNYAYFTWTAETADNVYESASDGFVIKDGKIAAQFYAGKITSKR